MDDVLDRGAVPKCNIDLIVIGICRGGTIVRQVREDGHSQKIIVSSYLKKKLNGTEEYSHKLQFFSNGTFALVNLE